ncbi:MAG TPA: acyltransferase family protein [Acidimicrobiales bacterium]|nr:acyltransferase family protein [Acidimicrobiales bacterium]
MLVEPTTAGAGHVDERRPSGGDRIFRPDVEGLRAVAVVLVVLFHSGISALSGGYVGVDVFFVISGFVITGVLLRERADTGRTSVLAFYGRRCRRIIPAASLVIVVTVVLAYLLAGPAVGSQTAADGRWASVFLANVHFASQGTNYLASQQPPSPLQNLWSLAVEEQFYLVYPTLFIVAAALRTRWAFRVRLAVALVGVIGASLAFSVLDTAADPTGAYFSPFTRAWELALGALVALATPWLRTVPARLAAAATWVGTGAILVAAVGFGAGTAYPGTLVAVPVLGAALVVAGGAGAPPLGVEAVLGTAPFRAMGRVSYSVYLWHWPILVLVAEHENRTSLPVPQSLAWITVAVVLAALTYRLVEDPIRRAAVLRRVRWSAVGLGAALVVVTVAVVTVVAQLVPADATQGVGSRRGLDTPLATIRHLVATSSRIRTVPADLIPALAVADKEPLTNLGIPPPSSGCWPGYFQTTEPACVFGDPSSPFTMVLYGDSHAGMWFRALDDIATAEHWRLVTFTKAGCPASPVAVQNFGAYASLGGEWTACTTWHRYAMARIDAIHPDLLVVSQASYWKTPEGRSFTTGQWEQGLDELFARLTVPAAHVSIIGSTPIAGGPTCLGRHPEDVQACSGRPRSTLTPYNDVESAIAAAHGARYVDTTPWFCTAVCSSVIGRYSAYYLGNHVAVGYSRLLDGVLAGALGLRSF